MPQLGITGAAMNEYLRDLLAACEYSLEHLRGVPGGTDRPIYKDLQTVREDVAAELQALGDDETG